MAADGRDRNDQGEQAWLTRISVRSSRDFYFVRHGAGPAVKVRRRGSELDCECGRPECVHVESLRLCGFVEAVRDVPMAA